MENNLSLHSNLDDVLNAFQNILQYKKGGHRASSELSFYLKLLKTGFEMWTLCSPGRKAFQAFLQSPTKAQLCTSATNLVRLNFEEFSSANVKKDLEPIVIAHGMLGSLANW